MCGGWFCFMVVVVVGDSDCGVFCLECFGGCEEV